MDQFIGSVVRRLGVYLKCRFARYPVLVLGDSHAAVFNHPYLRGYFSKIYFHVCFVGGATVSGLENPNSKTNSREIFESAQKLCRHRKKTIVMLGEVDTGFVIWYRAVKYDESVDDMLDKTILRYERFIEELRKTNDVVVISTPLPTIRDSSSGEVANLRGEVTATLLERTELTPKFNEQIRSFCEKHQVSFVSLDRDSLGENGLVKSELLNDDPTDHHYNQLVYAKLLVPKLGIVL